jgi:hypothetical protein
MDKFADAAPAPGQPIGPSDRLASASPDAAGASWAGRYSLPGKVYGVMAATTLLTFATLTTGYQMLFAQTVFA